MFKKIIEKLYMKYEGNLIYFDAMTGIRNRNYYEMVCRDKYAKTSAWIYLIDLNGLKKLNDEQGHLIGDKALKRLVEMLNNIYHDKDFMRIGGDEFVIFSKYELPLGNVLEEFIKEFPGGFAYGYYHKKSKDSFSDAMKKADMDMYKYKHGGII